MLALVVIVNYGLGNLASIANMGRKAGETCVISDDAGVIATADKLILPGVGAFDHGMSNLADRGLVPVLEQRVIGQQVPILGLCLGVQLFGRGREEGTRPGLGWMAADTRRFQFPEGSPLKVPHMGWNLIDVAKPSALVNHLPPEPRFYFVHAYHLQCDDDADVMCWTTYGYRFASGIQRRNIWGTQFHPEKSHAFGLALMKNFFALS